jgi:hypothetical protein
MTKINQKSYTYILAILFALGGLIFINFIDESDEIIFKKALASGKKEIFVGKLKGIQLVGFLGQKNELTFYKSDGSEKKFLVDQINTTNGLKIKEIKPDEWYEIVKIVNAKKIIDMHKSVENLNIDEIRGLTNSDKNHIQHYIDDEFATDLVLTGISLGLIIFSAVKIYFIQKK